MRVWIDVFDAAGNRLGDGAVLSVKSAQVTRALDGAGQFTATVVGVDPQAIELLTNERRVEIWVEDTGGMRILGQGIIRRREPSESQSGVDLSIDGPDILNELKRRNTLLARIYEQQTLATVAADLITLVPGWSVVVDPAISGDLVDARFDGVSVLKAFQSLVSLYGVHFRMSSSASRTVVISAFGEVLAKPRIFKTSTINQELLSNDDVLIVERIRTPQDSEDVVNWILVLGAGEGIAALTLEKSTRTTPYTIQSVVGPDGTTWYYISDATSVAAFGEIQRVVQFKEIAALSNTDAGIENAANALYDAAVQWLTRHTGIKESFSVTVKNVQLTIEPGDKIHMNYKEQVNIDGEIVDVFDIRDDFWIMMVTETVGGSGSSANLTLSNIDRVEKSMAAVVVSSIEAIKTRNLKPLATSAPRVYVYTENIAPGNEVTIPLEFTSRTLFLEGVRLRLKTREFKATSKSAEAGGASATTSAGSAHQHAWSGLPSSPPGNSYTEREFSIFDTDGNIQWLKLKTDMALPGAGTTQLAAINENPVHDHVVDIPAHTHDLEFGITKDSETPAEITVLVNGVDKTFDLFGTTPLAPSGGAINLVADEAELTAAILSTGGGLYQEHEIVVRCNSGQGDVVSTLEVFEVSQSIK